MTAILCAVIFVMSILSAFVFHCSLLFSLTAAAASAALFVFDVFLFKGAKFKGVFVAVIASVMLGVCIFAPPRATDYGALDRFELYSRYVDLANADKTDKAEKVLSEMTEKYGESDDTRYIKACSLVAEGNVGEAEEVAAAFDNKASPFYLIAEEAIISKKYASDKERSEALLPLYIEASDNNPDWFYPAQNAGGILFDKGEYGRACYYLTRAIMYDDEDDPELYYYLGASLCEQGLYDKGLPLLDTAYEMGIDDEIAAYIAYYVEISGKGESSNDG